LVGFDTSVQFALDLPRRLYGSNASSRRADFRLENLDFSMFPLIFDRKAEEV
jgi:hypothetical protein